MNHSQVSLNVLKLNKIGMSSLVWIQTLALIFPMTLIPSSGLAQTALPTPTPSFTSTAYSGKGCDDICSEDDAAAAAVCAHAGSSDTTNTDAAGNVSTSKADCAAQASSTLSSKCAARKAYKIAIPIEQTTMALYAAAGVACSAACIAQFVPVLAPGFAAAKAACSIGDIAALGSEIAGMVYMTKAGKDWMSQLTSANNAYGATIAAGAVGLGQAARTASQFAKGTAKEIGEKAAEKDALVCIAAGLDLATAAVKNAATYGTHEISGLYKNNDDTCNDIERLASNGVLGITGGGPNVPVAAAVSSVGTNVAGSSNKKAASLTAHTDAAGDQAIANLSSGQLSNATAGPAGSLLAQMPTSKIPEALSALGIDPHAFARKIAGGASVGAATADALGLTGDLADTMKHLDELAAKDPLFLADVTSSRMSGGGGGSAKAGSATDANPFAALFGNKDGGGPVGTGKELAFGKAAPKLDPANGDIFHSNWPGSIFQIISAKLTQAKDKVAQLEWASPLNRAIMGLPRLPASTGAASPATGK